MSSGTSLSVLIYTLPESFHVKYQDLAAPVLDQLLILELREGSEQAGSADI